jgi:methylenetetrahydrofolate--tRNA-(uracil-5-)-methyltransferase
MGRFASEGWQGRAAGGGLNASSRCPHDPYDVHIIGGGLAGSEAAWQLARRGIAVRLSEMRGTGERSPAHHTDALAELVCSNSFRSDDDEKNAVGLLHHEMRL